MCLDFNPEAIAGLLELIYKGETQMDFQLYKEVKEIMRHLQINMSFDSLEALTMKTIEKEDNIKMKDFPTDFDFPSKETFQCSFCAENFSHKSDFSSHMEKHLRPFQESDSNSFDNAQAEIDCSVNKELMGNIDIVPCSPLELDTDQKTKEPEEIKESGDKSEFQNIRKESHDSGIDDSGIGLNEFEKVEAQNEAKIKNIGSKPEKIINEKMSLESVDINEVELTSTLEISSKFFSNIKEDEINSPLRLTKINTDMQVMPKGNYICDYCDKRFTMFFVFQKHLETHKEKESNENCHENQKDVKNDQENPETRDINFTTRSLNPNENELLIYQDLNDQQTEHVSEVNTPITEISSIKLVEKVSEEIQQAKANQSDEGSLMFRTDTMLVELTDPPNKKVNEQTSKPVKKDKIIQPILVYGEMLYKCPLCPKTSLQYGNIIVHIASFHFRDKLLSLNGKKITECIICKKMMNREPSLLYHLAIYHDKLKYLLPFDECVDKNKINSEHLLTKDNTKAQLNNSGDMARNCASDLNQSIGNPLRCNLCKVSFNNETALLNHVDTHHDDTNNSLTSSNIVDKIFDNDKHTEHNDENYTGKPEHQINLKSNEHSQNSIEMYQTKEATQTDLEKRGHTTEQSSKTSGEERNQLGSGFSNKTLLSETYKLQDTGIFHVGTSRGQIATKNEMSQLIKDTTELSEANRIKSKICSLCSKTMHNDEALLEHMTRCQEEKGTSLIITQDFQNITAEYQTIGDSWEPFQKSEKYSNTTGEVHSGWFYCQMCNIKTTSHPNLIMHNAVRHFRAELERFCGTENGTCTLCSKIFKSKHGLLNHIAVQHDKLKDLLPSNQKLLASESNPAKASKTIFETIQLQQTHFVESSNQNKDIELDEAQSSKQSNQTELTEKCLSFNANKSQEKDHLFKTTKSGDQNLTMQNFWLSPNDVTDAFNILKDRYSQTSSQRLTTQQSNSTDKPFVAQQSHTQNMTLTVNSLESSELKTSFQNSNNLVQQSTTYHQQIISNQDSSASFKNPAQIFMNNSNKKHSLTNNSITYIKAQNYMKNNNTGGSFLTAVKQSALQISILPATRKVPSNYSKKAMYRFKNNPQPQMSPKSVTSKPPKQAPTKLYNTIHSLEKVHDETETGFKRKRSSSSITLGCHMCSHHCTDIITLKVHIGQFHLKQLLSKFYGKEEGECQICQKILLNQNCLIQHLIIVHGSLDKAIPDISLFAQLGSRHVTAEQSKKQRLEEQKIPAPEQGSGDECYTTIIID